MRYALQRAFADAEAALGNPTARVPLTENASFNIAVVINYRTDTPVFLIG